MPYNEGWCGKRFANVLMARHCHLEGSASGSGTPNSFSGRTAFTRLHDLYDLLRDDLGDRIVSVSETKQFQGRLVGDRHPVDVVLIERTFFQQPMNGQVWSPRTEPCRRYKSEPIREKRQRELDVQPRPEAFFTSGSWDCCSTEPSAVDADSICELRSACSASLR